MQSVEVNAGPADAIASQFPFLSTGALKPWNGYSLGRLHQSSIFARIGRTWAVQNPVSCYMNKFLLFIKCFHYSKTNTEKYDSGSQVRELQNSGADRGQEN